MPRPILPLGLKGLSGGKIETQNTMRGKDRPARASTTPRYHSPARETAKSGLAGPFAGRVPKERLLGTVEGDPHLLLRDKLLRKHGLLLLRRLRLLGARPRGRCQDSRPWKRMEGGEDRRQWG